MYPGGNLVKLSPSDLVAAAYTEGDVVFAKAELKNAVPSRGGCSLLTTTTMYIEGAAATDDLILLFFDNNTDLGEPAADPSSDITADEFRAASCIGALKIDGATATNVGNGLLYSGIDSDFSTSPVFLKAADGETSIWVACIQYLGTLDLTDTDSITCTFGFQYIS